MDNESEYVQHQPQPLPPKRLHAVFLEDSDFLPSTFVTPKRYCPEPLSTSIDQLLETTSEPKRDRFCRSDTFLGHADGDIVPRMLTESTYNVGVEETARGFGIMPITIFAESHTPTLVPS
ncbi:uncharacterized protein PAC_03282 [Phialocephala subalpina]|uniref:Uncharacterized protein n=1 Tax=Phialocephala subalpina TaxID=576137 RepID=A0A1L7WKU6_9HELO|nr:uncharacterized protein PAC_03282 [Phialocephala subalpina]